MASTYPERGPFDPSDDFPELSGVKIDTGRPNPVYTAIRKTLWQLGLDADRFGTADWNPLGEIINPGDRVVIKPNFVLHFNSSGSDVRSVVTHASLVRPVLDYVLKALKGSGHITVGDAPHGNADFEAIMAITGARDVVNSFRGGRVPVVLADFRQYRYGYGAEGFLKETRTTLAGDPEGYTAVDLGGESALESLSKIERLYGADYDRSIIRSHHRPGKHEYLIANSVLKADVVISMPKLKVHSKAGVTINLKNLVGINGDKNWLPHYRIGSPAEGGDEYPDSTSRVEMALRRLDRKMIDVLLPSDRIILKKLYKLYLRLYYPAIGTITNTTGNQIHRGNWQGNDTIWRTVLDLNRILLYSNKDGSIRSTPQRRFLSIVDGIIAGEGQGPLGPTPRPCGTILGGFDPLIVDWVGALFMGLRPQSIPLLRESMQLTDRPLSPVHPDETILVTDQPQFSSLVSQGLPTLDFKKPLGWEPETSRVRNGTAGSDVDESRMHRD